MHSFQEYQCSAQYIKSLLQGRRPEFLLALGSGLGELAQMVEHPIVIPYKDIPFFQNCSAPGHAGELRIGYIHGVCVMLMNGRMHIYEGYEPEDVAYPIRVAWLLGVRKAIFTNAAGGVNLSFRPGDLMVISDYIQFNMRNPLIGPHIPEFGARFPEAAHVYDEAFRKTFRKIAQDNGDDRVFEGVYFYASGPQFETPAEIRAMRLLGGDAVGMSTVAESMVTVQLGMRLLGVSVITNMASGIEQETAWDIMACAKEAGQRLKQYILAFLEAERQ